MREEEEQQLYQNVSEVGLKWHNRSSVMGTEYDCEEVVPVVRGGGGQEGGRGGGGGGVVGGGSHVGVGDQRDMYAVLQQMKKTKL